MGGDEMLGGGTEGMEMDEEEDDDDDADDDGEY
jgi:hypothetical protein